MENIFKDIPSDLPAELIEKIAGDAGRDITVERIISRGHASPRDFWYDQDKNEFVIVLKGKAGILFKGRDKIFEMSSGDYIDIPAHSLHRIEWTSAEEDTVWLAVHY
jgi:cupin 2 domain-containing protein